MDLIGTAWQAPSNLNPGVMVLVSPNFGTEGGGTFWEWTPTRQTPTYPDVAIPLWNTLEPVVWNSYVVNLDEQAALQQAGLVQWSTQDPATFVPPGVASLVAQA